MMKHIITLLFIVFAISAKAQYPLTINILPGADPDTCNYFSFYPSGSASLTGKGVALSYETLSEELSQYLGKVDTVYVNAGDSLVIIFMVGDTLFFAGGGGVSGGSKWTDGGATLYPTGNESIHIPSLFSGSTGALNVIGRIDLSYPTATDNNLALGGLSGNLSATGLTGNVSIGSLAGAGLQNSTASNVNIGYYSGGTLVASNQNTGIGGYTLDSIRSGANLNVAIGYGAIQKIRGTVSTQNIGIGYNALNTIKGNANLSNIAIGGSTLATLTGARNVAIGQGALTALVGSNNTVVGHGSFATNTAGSGNVSLGYQSGANETGSNKLYIENSNSTTPLIHGDFAADTVRINGDLSIRDAVAGASTDSVLVWTASNGRVKAVDHADFVKTTGAQSIDGVKTFTSDPIIPDEAYDATAWNGSLEPPTKNAVRDKIENIEVHDELTRYYYFNDYIAHVNADVVGRDLFASNSGSGAGTLGGTTSGRRNVVGVAQITTGTQTTGRACVISSTLMTTFGGGEWTLEAGLDSIPTLSTAGERYSFGIGFIDNNVSNAMTDGAYFLYDEGGVTSGSAASANWQCVSAAGTSRTYTTSSIAVTTGQQKLRIVVNAAGTQIQYYVNGALAATHLTSSGHYIPTTLHTQVFGTGWVLLKSAGTTSRAVNIDYFKIQCNYTTPK